ncbi:MAG TPA: two-component regulator propeller domain-containing protein [Cytophagaceae bacterium]
MYKIISTFVVFLCSISASFSQKPSLVFHHLSVNDGLSENTVRTITEDKKGFMWFGCEDGLNKYDGYKFTVYRNDNDNPYSISSRNIKYLFLDSKNNLWILTSKGINIYDPVLDIFYNFKNPKYAALKDLDGDIGGIEEDPQGNIWVSTSEDGLFKIESLDAPPIQYKPPFDDNSKHLHFLFLETKSSFLVGTRDGLLRFNVETEEFIDLRMKYGKGYEIRSIFQDDVKNTWLCTSNGLRIILPTGDYKEYFHNPSDPNSINGNNVINVVSYKDGNYLIGIDGGGLDYFDIKKQKFYHYTDELSSTNINSLYKDSKGDIWVGTYLNGINYSNPTTNLFFLTKNNLYSNKSIKAGIITRFLQDRNGNLWIASDGGGLYKKAKGADTFIHFKAGDKGLSSNVIIGLLEDDEGDIYITTYGGGLCVYNPKKDIFKTYKHDPHDPNSLFNNQTKALCNYNGKIWISGFGTGIDVFDKKTQNFTHYKYKEDEPTSLASDWVQCFYIDSKGSLWIGTFMGLSKYDPDTDSFINYHFKNNKTKNHVDINTILDITEDSKGNFWFATMGNGLVLFNRDNGSYKAFTTDDGLTNNCIKSIVEDNMENLWLSTNNGITRFNITTYKCKGYTIKDGVPPSSFYFNSKFKDEDGKIYFGANNGFLTIDPKMTSENKKIPPVVLTEFKLFNQAVHPGEKDSPLKYHISATKEINLSYNQNSIAFDFASLNFNSPQNNKYSYILEGFDETWTTPGPYRSATYTNLNPGTYIFKVKGSNNDNVWNEEGAFVKIILHPPFWETWWFNLFVISSIILIIYLLHKWRTNLILEKNLLLEETVKLRTSELKEANEQLESFVYKASHDIKGPLKSIIGLTTIGKVDVQKGGDPINYFDHILKSTSKLDKLLYDLLEVTKVKQATLKFEKISFKEIVSDALYSFENFPGYEKMEFILNIQDTEEFYSDKKLLYSLIQNLIENPIKYLDPQKPKNSLTINITANENYANLAFTDNGIGISEDNLKKVFDMFYKVNDGSNGTGLGLYIVKKTVEKLHGTIRVESTPGIGSTFYVNLKKP